MCPPKWPASRHVAWNCLKSVFDKPDPAVQRGDGRYADWVMISIRCLQEYLGPPYQRLLDVLQEMTEIVSAIGLSVAELPDFT